MTHEQVYVQDIVQAATARGKVEAITVEVGELAPILAEDLETAMRFTGWTLTVTTKPGTIQCRCGYTGSPVITDKGHDYTIFHCPECAADLPVIIDGKDVVLKAVVVKE